MKKSKSFSTILGNEEQIQGLYELSEEEKKIIQRRKQVENCKDEIKRLRQAIEEIREYKNQWVWVKYSRKVVMITHLITAVYIIAEKTMRVLNTSLYRTVSQQLSFSQLMKSWMQSKFKNSSLKSLKEFVRGYHNSVSRQYQDQKQKKKEHLHYLSQSNFSQIAEDVASVGLSSVFNSIAGLFGGNEGKSSNTLNFIDPADSLSYFGNDGIKSFVIDQKLDTGIPLSSYNLKSDPSTSELLNSRGFKSLVKLFGKETLQSGSLIFLVYWFGKHNIKKRVFATILLFLFNVYMLVFDSGSGTGSSRARFKTIIRWNVIFNLLSLTAFLLFKQHLNTTTDYSEQRYLQE